jgi:hypothetical protein
VKTSIRCPILAATACASLIIDKHGETRGICDRRAQERKPLWPNLCVHFADAGDVASRPVELVRRPVELTRVPPDPIGDRKRCGCGFRRDGFWRAPAAPTVPPGDQFISGGVRFCHDPVDDDTQRRTLRSATSRS